jgi:hypothetical protein
VLLARTLLDVAQLSVLVAHHRALAVLAATPESERNHRDWLEVSAEIQIELKNYPDAAELARRLLRVDPNNITAKRVLDAVPPEVRDAPPPAATQQSP